MESREYERKPYFQKRKEIRKENRLNKNKTRHDSWIQHQKAKKLKKMETNSNRKVEDKEKQHKPVKEPKKFEGEIEGHVGKAPKKFVKEPSFGGKKEKKENLEKKSLKRKRKENLKKKSLKRKTKFEEYLDLEMNRDKDAAANDLRMERRLAKKLRLKKGKERSLEDEMNVLFDGTSYVLDVVEDGKDVDDDEEDRKSFSLTRKHKKRKLAVEEDNDEEVEEKDEDEEEDDEEGLSKDKDVEGSKSVSDAVTELAPVEPSANTPKISENVKYIAPHLRARMKSESEEHTKIRRSVRGLLNRLSESNVESITVEISSIFRSMVRSSGSQIISEEVLASCSGGPRGNEQYAAVFAAFVAGMASSVGIDFGAKLVASLAQCFEDEYMKEDNLSLRNLTLLLSYLCVFGVCSSDLIYDFLNILSKRLMEIDVSTILTILQCCGMKLRGDDPTAMKNFVLSVQNRVNELKAPSGSMPDDQLKISNKRMEFMLETIFEIKNNKKKDKEDPAHFTRIKKWLQKLSSEDILLRGLTWAKLLDPNKKGLWWQTGDIAVRSENAEDVAITIDREVIEAQKLMQLATTQRMNTDARRSIFCIIMSGEDYVDAFEKLLRLDLPGKQDREIMRVLLECCLQEKVFNKYYCVLASRLCSHDKNHKFTLQYCIWDHYKALESMELIRSINLAKFTSEMFASFSLSLAVLKTVDLLDPKEMTPKRVMHFRMLFEALFENSDAIVWNMFSRIAILPELDSLRNGLEFFIKQYVVSSNKSLGKKFKIAKKAFSNMEGLLM